MADHLSMEEIEQLAKELEEESEADRRLASNFASFMSWCDTNQPPLVVLAKCPGAVVYFKWHPGMLVFQGVFLNSDCRVCRSESCPEAGRVKPSLVPFIEQSQRSLAAVVIQHPDLAEMSQILVNLAN